MTDFSLNASASAFAANSRISELRIYFDLRSALAYSVATFFGGQGFVADLRPDDDEHIRMNAACFFDVDGMTEPPGSSLGTRTPLARPLPPALS